MFRRLPKQPRPLKERTDTENTRQVSLSGMARCLAERLWLKEPIFIVILLICICFLCEEYVLRKASWKRTFCTSVVSVLADVGHGNAENLFVRLETRQGKK